jgi:hypothetical protein
MLSFARRRKDAKFEGKKSPEREREVDNQKNAKVQTELLRLRLDAGLSSCEEDTKISDYKKKEHFLASCTSINSQEQH